MTYYERRVYVHVDGTSSHRHQDIPYCCLFIYYKIRGRPVLVHQSTLLLPPQVRIGALLG
jgi:hypothetical protein